MRPGDEARPARLLKSPTCATIWTFRRSTWADCWPTCATPLPARPTRPGSRWPWIRRTHCPRCRPNPQRIGQVLGNLVTNALRHTPAGGRISLGADLSPDGIALRLWVADTGEGIPPEDLPHLFERFYRTDKSRARSTGGTELGLAIARHLVRVHGGEIGVESAVGQGTRFIITLPKDWRRG